MADDEECGEIRCFAHLFSRMKLPFLYPADLRALSHLILWDIYFEIWIVFPVKAEQHQRAELLSTVSHCFWQLLLMYLPDDQYIDQRVASSVASTAFILSLRDFSFITWWGPTSTALFPMLTSIHNKMWRWRGHLSLFDLSLTKSIAELYSQLPLLSLFT